MITIGFDVSKHELVGVRTDRSAAPKESFSLLNTPQAITRFFDTMTERYPKMLVVSEATAEYHRFLALECLKRGIPFRLLNPITTKQFTRATVRKRKTDLSDALIVAKLALQGEGTLLTEASFAPVKTIDRTARVLTRLIQMLTLMERRIAQILPDETEVMRQLAEPRLRLEQSRVVLRTRAQQATDTALRLLVSSVPGVGPTIATTLIAELDSVARFSCGKALVAYAGLDPKVRQSGLTLRRNTRLTKRGSPYLRRALYIAASIAQRHDPELNAYYTKKRNEGKVYREATVAVARKVLYRVYAVWKRGTPYVRNPEGI